MKERNQINTLTVISHVFSRISSESYSQLRDENFKALTLINPDRQAYRYTSGTNINRDPIDGACLHREFCKLL